MSIDPYSSPASHMQPPNFSASSAVSQGVLTQMAGTKSWVRFMSVLMFVGAGFILLMALMLVVMGSKFAEVSKSPVYSGGTGLVIAAFYALLSFLYIFPALKLWKYASHIGALLSSSSMLDLEAALSQQRSFWKFLGIMIIALFALYFVIIIALLAFGGFAAMKA